MLSLIILKRYPQHHRYFLEFYSAFDSLYNLYSFLTSDAYSCSSLNRYIELLNAQKNSELIANETFFEIKDGMAYINHSYDDFLPTYSTTIPDMIKILTDWHRIHKQKPAFIKITMDENQNINFTALDEYRP